MSRAALFCPLSSLSSPNASSIFSPQELPLAHIWINLWSLLSWFNLLSLQNTQTCFGVLVFCQFAETKKTSRWRPLGTGSGVSKRGAAGRSRMAHSLPWGDIAMSQLCHQNVPLFNFKLIKHWFVIYVRREDLDNQTCPFIKANYCFWYSEFNKHKPVIFECFSFLLIPNNNNFKKLRSGERKQVAKVMKRFLSVLFLPLKAKLHFLYFVRSA